MRQTFRFSLKDDKSTVVKGTISLNGGLEDLLNVPVLLPRLKANISKWNESGVSILLSPDSSHSAKSSANVTSVDDVYDVRGASTFVVAVVLVYGISIVFMISSHVFMKKRTNSDSQKDIDSYLSNARRLRDESRRESLVKLKRSLMPRIAASPSGRVLLENTINYTPYLLRYLPATALTCRDLDPNCHRTDASNDALNAGIDKEPIHPSKISHRPEIHSTDVDGSLTNIFVRITETGKAEESAPGDEIALNTGYNSTGNKQQHEVIDIDDSVKNITEQVAVVLDVDNREQAQPELSGDESSVYYSAQSLEHL